jgi:uncharacterized protein (TIGR01777 family)
VEVVGGDPSHPGPWLDVLAGHDGVVHLAGESVLGGRWTDAFKERLRASRVESTSLIAGRLADDPLTASGTPRVLVSASAIGYYGFRDGDEPVDESSPPGDDFLARLCVAWEGATSAAATAGCRVASVRVGVVLDPAGGALAKVLTPFRLGVGGPAGTGRQWMSWVHHSDLAGLFLLALENAAVHGPLNGTAPVPVTNREFARELGGVLSRPAFVPAPAFALRLLLGESADVVLKGQRVLPARAAGFGFSYRFPELGPALRDLLGPGSSETAT